MARKVNLEKVQASLDKLCPKCGKLISPAEVRRIDFERIECPACREQFVSGAAYAGSIRAGTVALNNT
jgi:ribosomal protein L37AE/L43A